MLQFWIAIQKLVQYNIKIIFGNKFLYFMLSALVFFIITVVVYLLGDDEITQATAYSMLMLPSILLVFYPMCFGLQNDQDAKIVEIIFGIPNYSYKVWLFRSGSRFLAAFDLRCLYLHRRSVLPLFQKQSETGTSPVFAGHVVYGSDGTVCPEFADRVWSASFFGGCGAACKSCERIARENSGFGWTCGLFYLILAYLSCSVGMDWLFAGVFYRTSTCTVSDKPFLFPRIL